VKAKTNNSTACPFRLSVEIQEAQRKLAKRDHRRPGNFVEVLILREMERVGMSTKKLCADCPAKEGAK